MADAPTSAESYLAQAKKINADRAQKQRIEAFGAAKAKGMVVPDLNPADKAVARMMKHAEDMKQLQEDLKNGPTPNDDLRDRVARLENMIELILYSLNNATIECVGGSVVLTLPDLPPEV